MQKPPVRLKSQFKPALLAGGLAVSLLLMPACQQSSSDPAAPAASEATTNATETSAIGDEMAVSQVTSADRNHATALLMQWWDLFEAPAESDRSILIDRIFAQDVVLNMAAGNLEGRDAVIAALGGIPETNGRSHHLHTFELTHIDSDLYALEATFQYHIAHLDGTVEAGESAYHHKIRKSADGSFSLVEINAEVLTPLEDVVFVPSYDINRARGALAYYLGTTDTLSDDYPALAAVLSSDAEIHGMFDPAKQTFNRRGDGVLRGLDEISPWLASRQASFDQVAHTISVIEVQSRADDRIKVLAQIETEAWPKTGDKIEVSLPIQIEMIETGEAFMRIAKINR
ncbi:MAG: nuclear transport factor 2 family protein [Pseudomonadota bacterium]